MVNTSTAGNQGEPSITALSNGDFVVTWEDTSGGGDTSGSVKAQLFDAGGHSGKRRAPGQYADDERPEPRYRWRP